jgi:integrase
LDEAMRVSWDSPPIRVDLEGGQYPRVVFFAEGQKSASDELWIMPRDLAEWLRKTPESARRGPVAPVGFAGMDLSSVSHVIAHIGEAAGVRTSDKKWASAQDFRRAFGTRWARKIRKPLTLQRLMRHASVQTTMAFYVDLGEADVGAELWGDFVPPPVQIKAARAKKQKRRPSKNSQKNDV